MNRHLRIERADMSKPAVIDNCRIRWVDGEVPGGLEILVDSDQFRVTNNVLEGVSGTTERGTP